MSFAGRALRYISLQLSMGEYFTEGATIGNLYIEELMHLLLTESMEGTC